MEFFVSGATARTAAAMVRVNKTTANYYFKRLRELIFQETEKLVQEYFAGEIEVDESYFGGVRKGKRGRGASGKVAVFGLLNYCRLFVKKLFPIQSFTPTASAATSYLSEFHRNKINHSKIFADKKNLTALRTFGIKPSVAWAGLTGLKKRIFCTF